MRYVFSDHARVALEARGLTEEEADAVLQTPEQIVPGKRGRRIYQARGTFANGKTYLLRAVVVEAAYPPIVATVYLTTKVTKYWTAEENNNENDV